jgi:hypothetical protein
MDKFREDIKREDAENIKKKASEDGYNVSRDIFYKMLWVRIS